MATVIFGPEFAVTENRPRPGPLAALKRRVRSP